MKKRIISLLTALSILATMALSFPMSASAADNTVSIILPAEYQVVSLMYDETDIYMVSKDNLWGLFSKSGNFITPAKWDYISKFNEYGFSVVYSGKQCGVIDRKGTEILSANWDEISFDAGVIKVCKGNLWGLYKTDGTGIFAPKYEFIEKFDGQYAKVFLNGKYGYINSLGEEIVPTVWEDTTFFSEGYAAVKNSNGYWGFVNEDGNVVIGCAWNGAGAFYKGKAWMINSTGMSGAINSNGSIVIPFIYEPIWGCDYFTGPLYSEGFAAVRKWGFSRYLVLDENGKAISDSIFDNIESFKNGQAKFMQNGIFGLARLSESKTAVIISIAAKYTALSQVHSNPDLFKGIISVNWPQQAEITDKDGKIIVPLGTFNVSDISNGRIMTYYYTQDFANSYGLYDFAGNVIVKPGVYERLSYVTDNILCYQKKYSTVKSNVNSSSSVVSSSVSSTVSSSVSSTVSSSVSSTVSSSASSTVSSSPSSSTSSNPSTGGGNDPYYGICGFINVNGESILSETFDYIEPSADQGFIKVFKNGQYGCLDLNLNTIVEAVWDEIKFAGEGFIAVCKNNKWGFAEIATGRMIDPAYDSVSEFRCGLAWFMKGIRAGAIDTNGVVVIAPEWTANYYDCSGFAGNLFVNGVAAVKKIANGKYCFIDKQGNKVTNYEFQYVNEFNENNLAVFSNGGKYGILKLTSNLEEGYTKVAVNEVKVTPESLMLYEGTTLTVVEQVLPSDATNKEVSFVSNNEAVAVVDAKGHITGISDGITSVTVASKDNPELKQSISITVLSRPTGAMHHLEDRIPIDLWEGQIWLQNFVTEKVQKPIESVTFEDLLGIYAMNMNCYYYEQGFYTHYETVMDQDGNPIPVVLPAIIGEFKNLCGINLNTSNNGNTPPVGLTGALPFEICYLSNLQNLSIAGSDIKSIPKEIVNLENLKLLNLNFNRIDTSNEDFMSMVNELKTRGVEVSCIGQKTPIDSIVPSISEITFNLKESKSVLVNLNITPYSEYSSFSFTTQNMSSVYVYREGNNLRIYYYGWESYGRTGYIIISAYGVEKARIKVILKGNGTLIPNDETGIPDTNLYKALLSEAYKNPDKDVLYSDDLASRNFIQLSRKGISSLKGFDKLALPVVSTIYLDNNQLTKVEGLSKLSNLRTLNLSNNYITDMENLPQYEVNNGIYKELIIRRNNLSSLEAFKNYYYCFLDINRNDIDTQVWQTTISDLQNTRNVNLYYYEQFGDKREVSLNGGTIKIGDIKNVLYYKYPYNINVTFSSSDESVAKVDSNGNVTGISKGTATINAKYDGAQYTNSCTVTVFDPELPFAPDIWTYNNNGVLQVGFGSSMGYAYMQYKFKETDEWIKYNYNIIINENCTIYARYLSYESYSNGSYQGHWSEVAIKQIAIDKIAPKGITFDVEKRGTYANVTIHYPSDTKYDSLYYKLGTQASWINANSWSSNKAISVDVYDKTSVEAYCKDEAGNTSQVYRIDISSFENDKTELINNGSFDDWSSYWNGSYNMGFENGNYYLHTYSYIYQYLNQSTSGTKFKVKFKVKTDDVDNKFSLSFYNSDFSVVGTKEISGIATGEWVSVEEILDFGQNVSPYVFYFNNLNYYSNYYSVQIDDISITNMDISDFKKLTSNYYQVDNMNSSVSNIALNTTVADFKSKLNNNTSTMRVVDANGNECADDKLIGTGMQLKVYEQEGIESTYTAVVYGDVSGDGLVNVLDLLKVKRHLLGLTGLSGANLEASDINHDGVVNVLDCLLVKRFILGTIDINQYNPLAS